jgi:NAD-dependent deacetylase
LRPGDLASPQSWADDPALIWAWYQKRRYQLGTVEPNAGHYAVAEWANLAEVQVITQNVDDLHERAGTRDPVHIHGRLSDSHCERCKTGYYFPVRDPACCGLTHPDASAAG